MRGSFEDGSFTNWYLQDGRVQAALTLGRSDDLDHARRLIACQSGAGRATIATCSRDPDSDLARESSA